MDELVLNHSTLWSIPNIHEATDSLTIRATFAPGQRIGVYDHFRVYKTCKGGS